MTDPDETNPPKGNRKFTFSPNTPHQHPDPGPDQAPEAVAAPTDAETHAAHGGHGLMMLVCCIPVILLAVTLIATGRFSLGALLPALVCVAMMGVMMLVMPGKQRHH